MLTNKIWTELTESEFARDTCRKLQRNTNKKLIENFNYHAYSTSDKSDRCRSLWQGFRWDHPTPRGAAFFPPTTEGVDFLNWWRAFIPRCATWPRGCMCYRPLINKLKKKKNVNALSIVHGVSFSRALSMLYFSVLNTTFIYVVKKKFFARSDNRMWMDHFFKRTIVTYFDRAFEVYQSFLKVSQKFSSFWSRNVSFVEPVIVKLSGLERMTLSFVSNKK